MPYTLQGAVAMRKGRFSEASDAEELGDERGKYPGNVNCRT